MAEQLKIDVVLKNFASKELALLDKSLTGFTKRGVLGFKNMAKSVFSLKGVLAGLGVGLAVRGISRLFTETADAAAKIDDLSVSLGVSTEALSELEFAAKLSGAGMVDLETGFRSLQKGLGEFTTTGRGVVRDVLDKLSPAFRQLVREGAPAEEVFKQVAREMKNLSAAERVFVTSQLFGRGGPKLIKLLTGDMDGLTKQAHRLGLTLTKEMTTAAGEFNDSLDVMSAHTQGLKQQLVLGLLPALTEFFKFLIEADTKGRPAMLRFLAHVVEGVTVLSASMVTLTSETISLGKALSNIDPVGAFKNFAARAAASFEARVAATFGTAEQVNRSLDRFEKLQSETFAASFGKASDAAKALSAQMVKLGKEGANGLRALADELDSLNHQGPDSTAFFENQAFAARGLFGIVEKLTKQGNRGIADLFSDVDMKKLAIAAAEVEKKLRGWKSDEVKKAADEAKRLKEEMEALANAERLHTLELFNKQDAMQGLQDGFRDLQIAAKEWGVAMRQAVNQVADALSDNISDGFLDVIEGTKSAKVAFADMAKGILKDLARIIVRLLVVKAIEATIGGLGNAFANAQGGLSTAQVTAIVGKKDGGIVPGHLEPVRGHLASGGIVRRRGLFEIAEGGQAEAVIPLINGTHIPTKDVGGRGRGGGGAPQINLNLYVTNSFLDSAHEGQLLQRNAKLMATLVGNEIRQSPAIREAFRAA